jgi:hypothetical protein
MLEHFDYGLRRMLSYALNIVAQMTEPQLKELWEYALRLHWECGHEMSAREASAVSDWPGGVLEAVQQSAQHRSNEGLERGFVDFAGYFDAEFRDAMAGSLPHSVVIRCALSNVELTDCFSVLADDFSALCAMN